MLLRFVIIAPMVMGLLGLTSCLYIVDETAVLYPQRDADSVQLSFSTPAAPETEPFVVLIGQLKEIGFYQYKQACSYPTANGSFCLVPPVENAISKALALVNSDLSAGALARDTGNDIARINMGGLLEIKSCELRADYKIQGNNFPRATVEEWTFDEELSAERVDEQLKKLNAEEWSSVSEWQISWWRKSNKLFFIFPGGNIMLTEVPKLQQKMQESM